MGRGIFLSLAVVAWWFYATSKTDVRIEPEKITPAARPSPAVVIAPSASRSPAQVAAPLNPPRNEVAQLPEHDRDYSTKPPLKQSGREWRYLDGVVAVRPSGQLPSLSELHGFSLVRAADVAVGTETFAVVERSDNGILGVMTGVLKAMGDRGAGDFLNHCPGEVVESYPALKSHLLRPSGEPDEFHYCLTALNRFKRLEWEILDRPRGPR